MGDLKLHEGWLMGLLRSTRATNQVESLEPRQLLSLAPFTPARSVPGGPYAPAVADAFALAVADNGSFVIAYGTAQHRLMVRRYGVTGDPLGIRVQVDWDGKPLAGLPAGAIRVRVLQQPDGMGNILHASKIKVPTGNTVTPTGDIQTPFDYKIAALGQPLIDSTTPKDVAVIPLAEEGKGIYSGSFGGTSIPGTYVFEAILDWDVPLTGHVSRQERLEEDVKPRADSAATAITLTGDASGVWTLTVTPRDRFGNYFGPGYAPLVKAVVRSGGRLRSATPADQDQLGAYVFTISGSVGVTPVVDVFVDGVLVSGR